MAQTTNYNLNMPNRGNENWDNLVNQNFDKIDIELKDRADKIGILSGLNTQNKTDLVGAINENVSQLNDIATLTNNFAQLSDIDDSVAINKALLYVFNKGGGKVKIPYRSTPYLIGSTLKIYSNTILEVDEGTIIKLKDGANTRLIENVNMTTQSNLTIIDHDIKIIGGIWDGNRSGQTKKWDGDPNVTSIICGAFFSGVRNLTFKPDKVMNTVTYGCLICNIENLDITNVEVEVGDVANPNNCDGIHLMGPINGALIANCNVKSEDNAIALNADDVGHGQYATMGDMNDITIKNITINNYDGGQGMRLLSGTSKISNVSFDGIRGKAKYLIVVSTMNLGLGNFDNIRIKNVDFEWYVANYRFITFFGNAGLLEFENIKVVGDDYLRAGNIGNIGIYISKNGTNNTNIDTLSIKNFKMDNVNGVTSNTFSVYIDSNTVIDSLYLDNVNSKNNATNHTLVNLYSTTINNLYLRNLIENSTTKRYTMVSSTITRIVDENSIQDNTFVPVLKGATTQGNPTYTKNNFKYFKRGNRVSFQYEVSWSGHDGTGQLCFNLPHTILYTTNDYQPVVCMGVLTTSTGAQVYGLIYRAASRVQFYTVNAGVMTALSVPASGSLYLSGSYYI